jgi:polynucleotide 5'-kinase involved in rRNA processing
LNLDAARQDPYPLACASLEHKGEPAGIRFVGSLSYAFEPLALLECLLWATTMAAEDEVVCELPIERLSPVVIHAMRTFVGAFAPDSLISMGLDAAPELLQPPVAAKIERRPPSSGAVRRQASSAAAWRKAVWRSLFSEKSIETIGFADVRFVGARFGCGVPLEPYEMAELTSIGIAASYAEIAQDVLYAVVAENPLEEAASSAASYFACKTVHLVSADAFRDLICGLENKNGDLFSVARIESVDFVSRCMSLQSSGEPPLPAAKVRFGRLRVDKNGNELGHIKAWQV